jgi:hypothetical protein
MSDVLLDEEGNEVVETPSTADQDTDNEETGTNDTPSEDSDERAGGPDGELDNAEDEDEREAIRARRREERKHRKEAQREREETLRRELASRDTVINELRAKVDVIERRNSGTELAQLDTAKKQTIQAYNYFKDQIRIATEQGNGAAVADATEKLIQAQRKFDEITNVEKAFKQKQATPPPLDGRLVSHAKSWMERNSWYDANGSDTDSRITLAIDNQLGEEGWDPTTPQYWQELESRVKKYLPHRVKGGKIATEKPKSVVSGSGRESASSQSAKGVYKLSADRVQALKDAGIWDDPKQRADAVKRYREFDKQESQG